MCFCCKETHTQGIARSGVARLLQRNQRALLETGLKAVPNPDLPPGDSVAFAHLWVSLLHSSHSLSVCPGSCGVSCSTSWLSGVSLPLCLVPRSVDWQPLPGSRNLCSTSGWMEDQSSGSAVLTSVVLGATPVLSNIYKGYYSFVGLNSPNL